MTEFKVEGLILPDCKCFKDVEKLKSINSIIDKISALSVLSCRSAITTLHLCEKAEDYYIAAIVWACLSAVVYKRKDDNGQLLAEDYIKEYEAVYDRIKPLVLQRLQYMDGLIDHE